MCPVDWKAQPIIRLSVPSAYSTANSAILPKYSRDDLASTAHQQFVRMFPLAPHIVCCRHLHSVQRIVCPVNSSKQKTENYSNCKCTSCSYSEFNWTIFTRQYRKYFVRILLNAAGASWILCTMSWIAFTIRLKFCGCRRSEINHVKLIDRINNRKKKHFLWLTISSSFFFNFNSRACRSSINLLLSSKSIVLSFDTLGRRQMTRSLQLLPPEWLCWPDELSNYDANHLTNQFVLIHHSQMRCDHRKTHTSTSTQMTEEPKNSAVVDLTVSL